MTDTELAQRLQRLERDNRRLKRLAVAGLALIAMLLVVHAVSNPSLRRLVGVHLTPQRIAAREFDVLDDSGKVRVKLGMDCLPATNCWPGISLSDENEKVRTEIGAGSLTIYGDEAEASLLDNTLQFSKGPKGPAARVTARLGSGSEGGGSLWLYGKGANYVIANSDLPRVELQDSRGFMMDLGSIDLTTVHTGETHQTSAASIVMFGNDEKHHLIWHAP